MKTLHTVWVEVHRYADPDTQGPDLRQTMAVMAESASEAEEIAERRMTATLGDDWEQVVAIAYGT